jgi:hypothetical protein
MAADIHENTIVVHGMKSLKKHEANTGNNVHRKKIGRDDKIKADFICFGSVRWSSCHRPAAQQPARRAPCQPHTQILPDSLDPAVKQSVCNLGSWAGSRILEKLNGSQDLARGCSRAMTEVLLELRHHRDVNQRAHSNYAMTTVIDTTRPI